MKLPNHSSATVDQTKVVEYLLNPSHPDNGGKARFFHALGFRSSEWPVLAAALKSHARDGVVSAVQRSFYGEKHVVEGMIAGPNGRSALARSVWIADSGLGVPRLVTAYPSPRGASQ